jgi:PIN domain nuclease of toxin-antitoxin system
VRRTIVDTECWLWWHLSPERLGRHALALFEERRAPLVLSAASSWEIAIKVVLGKLTLPAPPDRFVPEQLAEDDIEGLAITHAHALRVATLPSHHNDPFDRLLVAQSQLERCTLLTADPQLIAYDVDIIWGSRERPPGPPGRSGHRRGVGRKRQWNT